MSHPYVGKVRTEIASTANGMQSTERVGRDEGTIDTSKIGRARWWVAIGGVRGLFLGRLPHS